jgi:hypothetical protein
MELELGTGICSWAWWEEVPDLVLASVCDPTELEGVNCEVVCMRLFKFGCCWIGKELLTVEAQFFAELG